MLTSSGQAATMLAITNICEAGDHVICGAKCYGGSSNLLTVTLKRFGLETTLVDQDAPAEELEKAFRPQYQGGVRGDHLQSGGSHSGY